MCAIFGLVNYGHFLSKKQLKTLVNRLAVASEVRGTDASGIAYVRNRRQRLTLLYNPCRHRWLPTPYGNSHIPASLLQCVKYQFTCSKGCGQ